MHRVDRNPEATGTDSLEATDMLRADHSLAASGTGSLGASGTDSPVVCMHQVVDNPGTLASLVHEARIAAEHYLRETD